MTNQTTLQDVENFLSFSITPSLKAMLPTRQLAEVIKISPHKIVAIPQMPASVVGVLPWQGEILWVIDLSYWMGFEPLLTVQFTSSSCSLLKVKIQGNSLAFLIHQVGELQNCETQKIQSDLGNVPQSLLKHPARSHCIKGAWINPQGERLFILDAASMQFL